MKNKSNLPLESRIRGAIFGALVGDALGVPVEFKSRADCDADPVTNMRRGGMWGQLPGTWSDDGSMLLCTAEATLEDFSLSRFGQLYVRWMQSGYWSARGDVFDIGGTTLRALTQLADGMPIATVGEAGEGQNGNGSLMRTIPIGLRYAGKSRESLVAHAMAVSGITHAHARAKIACALYSVVAAELLDGSAVGEAIEVAGKELEVVLKQFPLERKWLARILDGRLLNLDRAELCSTGYVIDTLESALWCVARHDNFSAAVLAAVNLGGDTDTTGCVAGGLAGLMHGLEAIPVEWLDALPRRTEVEGLVQRFVAVCAGDR